MSAEITTQRNVYDEYIQIFFLSAGFLIHAERDNMKGLLTYEKILETFQIDK